MKHQWKHKYFYSEDISEEEKQNGYINYSTLTKAVDSMVLCNNITKLFYNTIGGEYIEPELYNGIEYDEENDNYYDIYQYYIISDRGAEILQELTDEIVYYIPVLDIYVWGITHFGTMWSGVNTSIKIVNQEG